MFGKKAPAHATATRINAAIPINTQHASSQLRSLTDSFRTHVDQAADRVAASHQQRRVQQERASVRLVTQDDQH